jgi:hypothetical protein
LPRSEQRSWKTAGQFLLDIGYRLGNVHIILKTVWKYVFRSMSRDFLIGCMTIKKTREENSRLTAIIEKGARHIALRASANINIYQISSKYRSCVHVNL